MVLFLLCCLLGKGTTNDGNTARRFFQNPELTARITGVSEELIKRFAVLLAVINSGRKIQKELFENYALETFHLYNQDFSWYYLPAHVHKLLLHSRELIDNSLLPLGMSLKINIISISCEIILMNHNMLHL